MASGPRGFGVKRLLREAQELKNPTELYFAQPLEENLFEWHFTIRGPPDSDFDGGIYHGRIIFPAEYPMKPPTVILLTPNGRFELHKRICLSISGFHPESWQPSWSIRTALLALVGFMPTDGTGAVGSLSYPAEERQKLAQESANWRCETCNCVMKDVLLPLNASESEDKDVKEARQLASQLNLTEPSKKANNSETAAPRVADTPSVQTEPPTQNQNPTPEPSPTVAATSVSQVHVEHGSVSLGSIVRIIVIISLVILLIAIFLRRAFS
uniref:UBIQUITIN_CONJUGAT_2 domain-containing protein n=1 Tax=Steinernema glaseri TaxID=37863 RepID=A0A1I7ZES4_9BILA